MLFNIQHLKWGCLNICAWFRIILSWLQNFSYISEAISGFVMEKGGGKGKKEGMILWKVYGDRVLKKWLMPRDTGS